MHIKRLCGNFINNGVAQLFQLFENIVFVQHYYAWKKKTDLESAAMPNT